MYNQMGFGFMSMFDIDHYIPSILDILSKCKHNFFNLEMFVNDTEINSIILDKDSRRSVMFLLSKIINESQKIDSEKYSVIIEQTEIIRNYLDKLYKDRLKKHEIPEATILEATKVVQDIFNEKIMNTPIIGPLEQNKDVENLELFSKRIGFSKADWLDEKIPESSSNYAIDILKNDISYEILLDDFVMATLHKFVISKIENQLPIKDKIECFDVLKEQVSLIEDPIIIYNNNNNKMEWLYSWFEDIEYEEQELLENTSFYRDESISQGAQELAYLGSLKFDDIDKSVDIYYSRAISYSEEDNSQIAILSKGIFKHLTYDFKNKEANEMITENKDNNQVIFNIDIFCKLEIEELTNENSVIIKLY